MNAFMDPLVEANGWSRAGISFGLAFASLCGTFSMPLILSLRSRSLRTIMGAGTVVGGLAYIGMGLVGSVTSFAMLMAVAMVAGQAFGGAAANLLMQRWFRVYRGRAFGLVNMGTSLSGAVLPFAAMLLVESLGLGITYLAMGVLVLAAAPMVLLWVRDDPADCNLLPDGDVLAPRLQPHKSGREVRTGMLTLLRSPAAWLIGLTFGVGLLTVAGVSSQLKPRFTDVGLDSHSAMACMCLTALFAAMGKYGWGWICDKWSAPAAARALFLCNALFLSLILLPPSLPVMALFIVGYGCSMGGLWTMFPALIAHTYGRDGFAPAYQYLSLFLAVKALGYSLMGISSSLFGTYDPAYLVMIFLLAGGFTCLCLFGRWLAPPDPANP